MIDIEQLQRLATGRWRDIFSAVGIDVRGDKRHGPCPICGGKDRFRVDDLRGAGTFYCSQCGAGDGLKLVDLYMNSFKGALDFVANYVGMEQSDNISMAEINANKAASDSRRAQSMIKEAEETAVKNEKAATTAGELMKRAFPADPNHPYLLGKQINKYTAWQLDTKLIIPMVNWKQELVNVQEIDVEGNKKFLFGGALIGSFHIIGRLIDGAPILITEGFATGCTIHQQTNIPVIVAFTAGNLLAVVESVAHLYSESKLLVCADNDHHLTVKKKPMKNTGIQAATNVFVQTGVNFIAPPSYKGVSDFNDLFVIYGVGCGLQIINALSNLQPLWTADNMSNGAKYNEE